MYVENSAASQRENDAAYIDSVQQVQESNQSVFSSFLSEDHHITSDAPSYLHLTLSQTGHIQCVGLITHYVLQCI